MDVVFGTVAFLALVALVFWIVSIERRLSVILGMIDSPAPQPRTVEDRFRTLSDS